jgi:hypothetical protein
MQYLHKTQPGPLDGTDSGFAWLGDGSNDLGTGFSNAIAASMPWGTTGDQIHVGYTKGGNHSGSSGSGGSTGGSGGGTQPPPPPPSPPPASFTINVTWDSSVASAPAGFRTAVMSAVDYLEAQFHDPVAINITVGYENLGTGILGESAWGLETFSYSQVLNAMKAHDTTANDTTAIASLPASSSDSVYMTPAEAQALGLAASGGSDGSVWACSDYSYSYNDANGVAGGTYDLRGIMLHEITEVMGRDLVASATNPSVMGLFDYKSAGVRDTSDYSGYFSINGGTTNLATFNTNTAGDPGDWAITGNNDTCNAGVPAGTVLKFSGADATTMDVLGYEANPYPFTPAGVTIASSPSTLGQAMSSAGLNPNVALASFTATNGIPVDTYTFALSGPNAASFALSGGKLMAAGTGTTGAVNGELYSLAIATTDATAKSAASPADPLDLIIGSSGSDIIQVGSLASSTTPTFVYGLGGGDTINGTGMTSSLWIAAGPGGGDTMTGGSGVNSYMFSNVDDSPVTAMDYVTNFSAGADLLDFSGISPALADQGSLTGSTISANSIGWQQSGGDTFVYVNTSSASASLGAANLEIGLQGTIALASKNIVL